MSLILEALRRSEAERHQESLPESLAKHQVLLYQANKRAFYWPVFICLLLLINLGVLGYFAYQTVYRSPGVFSESVESVESINGIKSTPAQSGKPPSPMTHANRLSTRLEKSDRHLPTLPTSDTNLSAARATLAERLPAPSPASSPNSIQFRITDQNKLDLERYTPVNRGRVPAQPELIAPSQKRQNQQSLNDEKKRPNAVNNTEFNAAPNYAASAVAKPNLVIPHINELNKTFLATLPRLVFNSHIYSKKASGRRIMINDIYLREGESFSGIKVIEITEEGVVLEKQTQQFRVPVVRDWSPAG